MTTISELLARHAHLRAAAALGPYPDDTMDAIVREQYDIARQVAVSPCSSVADFNGVMKLFNATFSEDTEPFDVSLRPLLDRLVADAARLSGMAAA